MLYLIFVSLFIGHIDSSKIELPHRYKKIKIFNQNGNINIEYIPSDTSSYLKIKKKARGKLEKFKEWIKEVKIITKEEDDFYEIKVEYPEKFKGLDDKSVELTLILSYELEGIEAEVLNGEAKIKEMSGEVEVKVINGTIDFAISHDKFLNAKLKVLNGSILISCPHFTQIIPEVVNGEIKGELSFEKSDIFQKIECSVTNGNIEVKRR